MPNTNEPSDPATKSSALAQHTADWVAAPVVSDPSSADTANLADYATPESQLRPPTPGPGDPNLSTATEATERMGLETPDGSGLPQVPGYRVEAIVGKGGMGRVYRAVHLELDRVEALKLITMAGRDETYARGRFDREVKSLAAIEHPNVVPVYHAGNWMGFPYLTMKFIAGGALSQHLKRFTGNPEACAKLMSKVCRAVQALHDAGILHRDLKPLNILLGESDEPLVADFGLARWLDDPSSEITCTLVPVGTRPYMSPEQTLGQRELYGVPCDVWAIGVTLYELLAGRRPFVDSEDGKTDLFEQIRSSEVPLPPHPVPPDLLAIACKCMAKKPEDRYQSSAAIADDLDRWLRGEQVEAKLAPPAPPSKPPPSFWRRNRIALGGLGLFLVLLPAGIPLWLKKEPPVKPPEQRLAEGDTVILIDKTGLPLLPAMPIPGCDDILTTKRDGYSTLTSAARPGAVELWNKPLPYPVRFEVEFALTSSSAINVVKPAADGGRPNMDPRVGVYVGRKVTPLRNEMHQTLIWFYYREEVDLAKQEKANVLSALCWGKDDPLDDVTVLGGNQPIVKRKLPGANTDYEWQKLSVVLDADRLNGIWGDTAYSVSAGDISTSLGNLTRLYKPNLQFAPPVFGQGIGLLIDCGEAVYRNAKLIPLPR